MSATIGNFYERVSRAIRRGTVYDDDIPGYAADAVRELENQNDWLFMELQFQVVLTEGQVSSIPITRLKNLRMLQLLSRDSAGNALFHPLRKTRRENVTGSAISGRPGAWWFNNFDPVTDITTIQFDAIPDQEYTLRGVEYKYSERPLLDSLAWLRIAEDLLIARTIRKMQPLLRDDALIARWQEVENSVMPALLEAELVHVYDASDNQPTPFALELEEDALSSAEF